MNSNKNLDVTCLLVPYTLKLQAAQTQAIFQMRYKPHDFEYIQLEKHLGLNGCPWDSQDFFSVLPFYPLQPPGIDKHPSSSQ